MRVGTPVFKVDHIEIPHMWLLGGAIPGHTVGYEDSRSCFIGIAAAVRGGLFGRIASAGSASARGTMRKVVLEKVTTGYHWKIEQAPVPAIGEHEVLVRVHAVSLNRGDLNRLEPDSDGRRTGEVPVTDAAGEVVAVGGSRRMFTRVSGSRALISRIGSMDRFPTSGWTMSRVGPRTVCWPTTLCWVVPMRFLFPMG